MSIMQIPDSAFARYVEIKAMREAHSELTEYRRKIERVSYPGNRHERRKAMAKDKRK